VTAIRTTTLLADIAPRHDDSGNHTALVVVSVVLAVAAVVLVYAAMQRRK
jgi:hypothetical protein